MSYYHRSPGSLASSSSWSSQANWLTESSTPSSNTSTTATTFWLADKKLSLSTPSPVHNPPLTTSYIYPCSMCGKKFTRRFNKTRHERKCSFTGYSLQTHHISQGEKGLVDFNPEKTILILAMVIVQPFPITRVLVNVTPALIKFTT